MEATKHNNGEHNMKPQTKRIKDALKNAGYNRRVKVLHETAWGITDSYFSAPVTKEVYEALRADGSVRVDMWQETTNGFFCVTVKG